MHEYSYLKRVEMSVSELKIGMYVASLDKPWKQSSFLFQGFPIEHKSQLAQLRKECRKVTVEFRSHNEYEIFLLSCEFDNKLPEVNNVKNDSFKTELPNALLTFKNGLKTSQKLKQNVSQSVPINFTECELVVEHCITSLRRNKSVLLLLINLRHQQQYNVEHNFRVTILSIAFGIYLGMSDEQIRLIGIGALLHDVGKSTIPENMLNKPDKLNKTEAFLFKSHPTESFRLLSKIEGVSEAIKEIALSYHEREDGKGYPRQIPKDRVSRYAKIVGIVSCYDAMISERSYRAVKSTKEAVIYLKKSAGNKFNSELVAQFVKWLGDFPVGSLVEMNSGELGVVISNGDENKPYPEIALVTDEIKNKCFQKVIDLSSYVSNSKGVGYEVKSILENNIYGINVQDYLLENVIIDASLNKRSTTKQSPFAKYLS
jgi:HD-GYP domain-containing protein (c-di-GMP phosphodiesterase class II)